MVRNRNVVLARLFVMAVALSLATGVLSAQSNKKKVTRDQVYVEKFKKVAPSLQKKAATQARQRGMKPGKAGTGIAAAAPLGGTEGPGGIPHYFGPYGNWAFSPLPSGTLNTVVTVDAPGSGYSANPTVTVTDAYDGTLAVTSTQRQRSPQARLQRSPSLRLSQDTALLW